MLILIAGVPYTGKTVSACTFPGKKLYLDWDDNFESVKHTKGKDGKLIVPDWKNIIVIKFIKSQVSDLDFGYSKQKDGLVPAYTKGSEELITRYNKIVTELGKTGCITWGDKKIGPFDTVIVDSLTGMFNIWEDMIFRNSGVSALGKQEYGQLKNLLFKQFIPAMKTIHEKIKNVILVTHEIIHQDDKSKVIDRVPLGPSAAQGRIMAKDFTEVWRQIIDKEGVRVWKTSKDGLFKAGSRTCLPDIKPATFQRLSELIK